MNSDKQKLTDIKEDELHFINSIIKNVKYLEHMYKNSLIRDEKEASSLDHHLNLWEVRKQKVLEHLEMLQSGEPSECILSDITSLSKFVGNYLDGIEDKKKNLATAAISNITQKDWMEGLKATQAHLESKNDPRKIFTDATILDYTKGYMVGPVGVYDNVCLTASTQSFDSLDELKKWVLQTASSYDMVLYMTYEENGKYVWRGATV